MIGPPDTTGGGHDDSAVIASSLDSPEVFAELYSRYAADIHRYATRRLGDAAADDITADTFLSSPRSAPARATTWAAPTPARGSTASLPT